jgi:hypothetical protein
MRKKCKQLNTSTFKLPDKSKLEISTVVTVEADSLVVYTWHSAVSNALIW